MKRGIVPEHSVVLGLITCGIDLAAIVGSALVAYRLDFGGLAMPGDFLRAGLIGLLLGGVCFERWVVYRSWRGAPLRSELEAALGAWLLALLLLVPVLQLTGDADEPTHRWLLLWALLSLVALAVGRALLRAVLRHVRTGGRNVRRVVVVVDGEFGLGVLERLAAARWAGLDLVGYFVEDAALAAGTPRARTACLGQTAGLAAFVGSGHADQVWIALPFRAEARMRAILYSLRHCTADIRLVPDIFGFRLLNHSLGEVAGLPVINLASTPMSGTNRLVKALEDRTLALVCLLLAGPLLIALAIAVRLSSPGPVFFRPLRLGYDGRPFRAWKFRCAVPHAGRGRYTPFGVYLRHTGLEGLPQLLNVLDGSMSIVGPCPHAAAHNAQYRKRVDGYMRRFKVKPGLTGWAQVHGHRDRIDTVEAMERRLELDLEYIENWSLELDLRIVALTVWQSVCRVLTGSGAARR